jgi:desulfoferrodoxin-like iron-binding protein
MRGGQLSMAQVGEVFVCSLCGNEVTVIKAGGNPDIHCCGQAMIKK